MGNNIMINKIETVERNLRNAVNSDLYRSSVSDYNYARKMSAYWIRMRNDAHISLQSIKSSYIAPLRAEKAFCNREGREVSLLASLRNQATPCGMSFRNSKQVKFCFGSDICEEEICYFYPVCNEICALGNKGNPAMKKAKGKKAKVIRKTGNAPTTTTKKALYKKTVEKGVIYLAKQNGSVLSFAGNEWAAVCKEIRDYFATGTAARNELEEYIGKDASSTIAGYTHKGQAAADYPFFRKFNG